ncbi:hypothetical protein PO909_022943 [Leuciscus waleckii]
MISACLEIIGLGLSVIGTLLVMVACGLPMWKVSAFIEGNILVAQNIWDGLWMSCVVQSTGQMQCKMHDSVLALTTDLQTARALTIISAVLGVLALMITIAGAQCTNCISKESIKARVVNVGGVIYIIAGLFVLVQFYDPHVPYSKKREIGAALYIGWAGSAMLLVGGAILCFSRPQDEKSSYPLKYIPPPTKSTSLNGDYDKRNYV